MQRIDEIFLDTYRNALKGQCAEWEDECTEEDWKLLFRLAQIHGVYPMIFNAVSFSESAKNLPEKYLKGGAKKCEAYVLSQAERTAVFLDLMTFLYGKGLNPVVVKGAALRQLYPNPEYRTSADEDIMIREEEFEEYHQALLEYGLCLNDPDTDLTSHEITYIHEKKLIIELHKKPFPPSSKAYGYLNRYFTHITENITDVTIYGIPIKTPDYTDHLFYLICHLYKHFLYSGIGIRQISDLVLFSITFTDKINWNVIIQKSTEIQVLDFIGAIYKIGADLLYPESFPRELRILWRTDTVDEKALLEDVLKGGLYGAADETRLHSSNITLNRIEKAKNGSSAGYRKILFPSPSTMKKDYPMLKKHPYLLPLAWCLRISSYIKKNNISKDNHVPAIEALRIGRERVKLLERYHMIDKHTGKGDVK